jgi:hypothetical protein
MFDPLTLRILGLLLFIGGGTLIGLGWFDSIPSVLPGEARPYMIGGGIAAALGALSIVFSAFFRRGRHGLNSRPQRRTGKPSAIKRLAMFWGGLLCVIVSPIIGPLPGPWSILLFAFGFGLMLKASRMVKKRYVRFKKRFPNKGDWVDWGLRRPSYTRRQERAKAAALAGEVPDGEADLRQLEPGCKN